jgi:hypothetical protein
MIVGIAKANTSHDLSFVKTEEKNTIALLKPP